MEEIKLVKDLAFGETARSQVLTGVEKLTNAVGSTLGASGKCVIIEDSNGTPQITKDGVSVANSITLRDPLENIGATLIKQAAQRTVKEAGDGTTTATILAQAILKEANDHSLLDDVRAMKEGINSGVDKVIEYLNKKSKKISGKKINQVATISSNNDTKLGSIIGEAFKMVDETGVVIMEINDQNETKDRVEDAICATKAAIKDGIVPGGGIALLNASQNLKPTCIGEEVLYCAIRKPYETILRNAGITEYVDPDEDGRGLDVVTGNTVDMVKAGIIDPLLVTKSALVNAASVATTILSTDCVINNIRHESDR